ncbi:hypothetical protein FN846DRAFT_225910 [Sphaerosporella brunnea]|uniref:1-alkyl-2-acetylglycerophosphocholine esterase n=1 Tax=Sphaerosporella brunnea TaxID=1250544 RepID=A0A5J5EMH4_9PEZI|nr:hypothetical protein FN846DRAFT_225910 [Sphaerosporella brunnea]
MQLTHFLTVFLLPSLAFSAPSKVPQLPRPTGPHKYIGTHSDTLIDTSRLETLGGPPNTHRKVVVQGFYPISKPDSKSTPVHYAPPLTLSLLETEYQIPPGTLSPLLTNSYFQSTPKPAGQHLTPLLFSTGMGMPRCLYTTFYEQLASEGYFVVAIDHPYDAAIVEFPGGEFKPVYSSIPNTTEANFESVVEKYLSVRVADAKFVASQLKLLPASYLDLSRLGMFGHSLGGAASAGAMVSPSPIKAGINLDGTIFLYNKTSVTDYGRKFLLMGTGVHNSTGDETTWGAFEKAQKGWIREIAMQGFTHGTYTDIGSVVLALGLDKVLDMKDLQGEIGTVKIDRARELITTYVKSFFEFALDGQKEGLMGGPNKKYPEAVFIK